MSTKLFMSDLSKLFKSIYSHSFAFHFTHLHFNLIGLLAFLNNCFYFLIDLPNQLFVKIIRSIIYLYYNKASSTPKNH